MDGVEIIDFERLKRARFIKTCVLPIAFLTLGLKSGITGPTLVDLTELQHCSVEDISRAIMFMPLGIALGSVTGAVLTDHYPRYADLCMALACCTIAVSIAAVPWAPSLVILGLCFIVFGFSQGNLNLACTSLTIQMWGEQASMPIHALHTFHSIGALIAAPMAGPFLSNNHSDPNNTWTDQPYHFSNTSDVHSKSRIYIPYGIIGVIGMIACCCFVGFQCLGWTFWKLAPLGKVNTEQNIQTETNRTSEGGEPGQQSTNAASAKYKGTPTRLFKWTVIIAMFFSYAVLMYRDMVFSTFLFTIGVKSSLQMPKQEATYMATSYMGSYAAGRVVSIIASKYMKIHVLLCTEILSSVILCGLVAWLGLDGRLQLWVLVCALSFFSAPTYPSIMAWVNVYLVVSGVVMAAIDIGIGTGSFTSTWAAGYIFDHYGSVYLFYLSFASAVLLAMILVLMQIVAHCSMRSSDGDSHNGNGTSRAFSEVDENTPLLT